MIESLKRAAKDRLATLVNVDGAFVEANEDVTIIVVAVREHGLVDREKLCEIEDALETEFEAIVELKVRAHQGRGASTVSYGQAIL